MFLLAIGGQRKGFPRNRLLGREQKSNSVLGITCLSRKRRDIRFPLWSLIAYSNLCLMSLLNASQQVIRRRLSTDNSALLFLLIYITNHPLTA